MKGGRLAAAVLILAALLGGYYLYKEVWLPGKEAEDKKASLLLSVDAGKVERIRVRETGAEMVEVVRQNGQWRLMAPLETEADQKTANRATLIAEALTFKQDLGQVENLEEFGLDEGHAKVLEFIHQPGGESATLRLGAREMVGGGLYASVGGANHVYLLDGFTAEGLDLSLILMRKKNFFDREFEDMQALEYSRPGMEKIRIERSGDGEWRITSPVQTQASTMAVDGLAKKFLRMNAIGFHEEDAADLAPYGLDKPRMEFTAYFSKDDSGTKITLGANTPSGAVYALWPDGKKVVRVVQEMAESLPGSIMDLRELSLMSLDITSVTGITVTTEKQRLEIKKKVSADNKPDRWEIIEPVRTLADPVGVSSLLNAARSIKAAAYPGGKEEALLAGKTLEKPDLELRLDTDKGPVTARFSESRNKAKYWAAADGNPEILVVAAEEVKPLRKGVFELRERRLLAMASADVTRVRIERLGETFEIEKNADDYMVILPERARIRHGEWTEFLWTLLELRFAGVISEEKIEDGDPAFGKPAMVITIFGESGEMLERVEIAKSVDDDKWYRARLANRPGLYDVDWFYVEDDVTLGLEKLLGADRPGEESQGFFR
ncbi:MAG: DUF4340 domain-containing protein [Nitrospinota bacterium]|nr:DUF4340 domain-containing protein [Nitrospinota bacterium]MDH5677689.1 DUF4340 domain-containing protein [Nitrospinota bacterium]